MSGETVETMDSRSKHPLTREPAQIGAALLALMLGLLIYLVTRPQDRVMMFSLLPEMNQLPKVPGSPLLYAMPSLLHTYAFILLTFSVLSDRLQVLRRVSVFWVLIELLIELGQRQDLAVEIVYRLPDWIAEVPVLNTIPTYFLHGRYDPLDQLFVLLGALAAYGTVLALRRLR